MPVGTRIGLGPGRIVLHGDPAPPPKRAQPPDFRPMSIVAKRSPISATAEHLLQSVKGLLFVGVKVHNHHTCQKLGDLGNYGTTVSTVNL